MKKIYKNIYFLTGLMLFICPVYAVDLKGSVSNAAAKCGLSGVIVTVYEYMTEATFFAETDAAGDYEIKGLKKGTRYTARTSYGENGSFLPKEMNIVIASKDNNFTGLDYIY